MKECNLEDDDPLWLKVLFNEKWKKVNFSRIVLR